jgi:hypothetical protein
MVFYRICVYDAEVAVRTCTLVKKSQNKHQYHETLLGNGSTAISCSCDIGKEAGIFLKWDRIHREEFGTQKVETIKDTIEIDVTDNFAGQIVNRKGNSQGKQLRDVAVNRNVGRGTCRNHSIVIDQRRYEGSNDEYFVSDLDVYNVLVVDGASGINRTKTRILVHEDRRLQIEDD